MSLISSAFLAFILCVTVIYYLLPGRARMWLLLAASLAFCCFGGLYTLIFVLLSAGITFVGGKFCKGRSWVCVLTVLINLALLCAVKFYGVMDVFADRLNTLFGASEGTREFLLFAVPIGMSFYTLQMTGYVLDCFWERIKPERNYARYLLFASYFPYLTSGPMNTYSGLSVALEGAKDIKFSWRRIEEGAIRICWGFFKKLVIADRAAVIVNAIYADHMTYTGLYIVLGVVAFAIQLYADFSGCMDVVLGTSHLLGIELPENFNSPYLARSIREYWQRWHTTLGNWLRDYLFYPVLKSSLFVKIGDWSRKVLGKKRGKKIPVYLGMIVLWFAVGYWHGGVWKYIIGSGLLHCFYIVSGMIAEPLFAKIRPVLHSDSRPYKVFQIVRTFVLVLIGFVFFRSSNVPDALDMFAAIGRAGQTMSGAGLLAIGLDVGNLVVLVLGVFALMAVDIYKYRPSENDAPKSVIAVIESKPVVLRWAVFMLLLLAVLLLGRYGLGYDAGSFIYARI